MFSKALDQLASVRRKIVEEGARTDDQEIKELMTKFQDIRAVIDDEASRQVMDNAVGDWLIELKDMSYDIDDALDELNTGTQKLKPPKKEADQNTATSMSTRKVPSSAPCYPFSCRRLMRRREVALKLGNLSQALDGFGLKRDPAGDLVRPVGISVVDSAEVYGRDEEKKQLLTLLIESCENKVTLPVVSVVGIEGIGKTALARQVFHSDSAKTHFTKRIWVSASYPLDEIRVAKEILRSLEKDGTSDAFEMETVLQRISQSIQGWRFLLVLDDVWTEYPRYWEQLKYCLKSSSEGSRILVTTCKASIADKMVSTSIIPLGRLSEEGSWSLFYQIALRNNDERRVLESVGRQIVGKCKGLPLAIKIIASLMCFKRSLDEWQRILYSEVWKLEQEETEHFLPLLLSYQDFPCILKKCFSYCAIFPKNYEMEKDRLIKLWMAQGYLKVEGKEDMEILGEVCFQNLATRYFFQDFQRNELDGTITKCKMHDIVHDFSQFLTERECFTAEVYGSEKDALESSYEKLKHLMILFESENRFPVSGYNKRKLRSLVIKPSGGFMTGIDLSELFDKLTCLRTLDLSNQDNVFYNVIKKVPRGIGKLIHLRYLNLSGNSKLTELPETVCELYNLETIELSRCISLKRLPQRMGQLINLWHVVNDETSLMYMPKGIERLTCLRTLSEFIVSAGSDDGKACKLECLKSLNNLRGSLRIKKLGNMSKHEINKADLGKKEHLLDVYLNFEKDEERGRTHKDDEDALEGLQVPQNLERLEISYYRGNRISSIFIMSLTKLRSMSLDRCINLEHLPGLGELPSLESLTIRSMRRLEKVGDEFSGIDESKLSRKAESKVLKKAESKVLRKAISKSLSIIESKPSKPFVAFPRLKYLEFQKMKGWKEWKYSFTTGTWTPDKLMPHLRSLTIGFCPKLETLPNEYLPLSLDLKIIACPKLEERYAEGTTEREQISHINLHFF